MAALGRELARSLAGTALRPRLVAEHPKPTWQLGAVTVLVGRERADLRYAREPIGWCKPTASAIAVAVPRALERLAERSQAPDALLPRLAAAYGKLAKRAGDRVPLVAIRDALDTTRAQFAWDLARLQRERRLAIGKQRIDLGVATGHAASRRSRVVFVENATGGAFYETFRLIQLEESR
jgi:hypothetical protein